MRALSSLLGREVTAPGLVVLLGGKSVDLSSFEIIAAYNLASELILQLASGGVYIYTTKQKIKQSISARQRKLVSKSLISTSKSREYLYWLLLCCTSRGQPRYPPNSISTPPKPRGPPSNAFLGRWWMYVSAQPGNGSLKPCR